MTFQLCVYAVAIVAVVGNAVLLANYVSERKLMGTL